jgi:hypothetical protein
MGKVYSTHGRGVHTEHENLNERDSLEDPDLGRMIKIKEDIRGIVWVGVQWIHLAQNMD